MLVISSSMFSSVAPAGASGFSPSLTRSTSANFLTFAVSASLARSTDTSVSSPFFSVKSALTFLFGASAKSLAVGSSSPIGRSFCSGFRASNSSVSSVRNGAVALMCSVPSEPPEVVRSTFSATAFFSASVSFFCVLASRLGSADGSSPPRPSAPDMFLPVFSISFLESLIHPPSRSFLNAPASGGSSLAGGSGLPDISPSVAASTRA